jgi:tRNA dimethylallyltransferase
MDVGTAKPGRDEVARVPHHLLDIIEPTESYSAGRFRDAALALVPQIHARGRIPLLVGGTMLYYRTLTRGLADLPPAQPAIRARLERRAAEQGWPALHAELARVDPVTAARLEPMDAQRIERALEVYEITGTPLSSLHAQAPPVPLPFEVLALGLEASDRAVLHERIAQRFRAMLAAGLVEELEALRARHALQATMPSMRAVGYRQAWDVLEGAAPRATLEERGIAATRQLAKRQATWMRPMPALERHDCLAPGLADRIAARVEDFVSPRRGT